MKNANFKHQYKQWHGVSEEKEDKSTRRCGIVATGIRRFTVFWGPYCGQWLADPRTNASRIKEPRIEGMTLIYWINVRDPLHILLGV